MKKRVVILLFAIFGAAAWWHPSTASASQSDLTPAPTVTVTPTPALTPTPTPVPAAWQIYMKRYPVKTTYAVGEELDLTGLIVESSYVDGTKAEIADYTITGYNNQQIGYQTVYINYQNCSTTFGVTVVPAKVRNVAVSNHDTGSYTLRWDASADASYYEIYVLNELTGSYEYAATTTANTYTFYFPLGTYHTYQVRMVQNNGSQGAFSDPCQAATSPEGVTGLTILETAVNSVWLSWSPVAGATGYSIFRRASSEGEYVLYDNSAETTYTDTGVATGTAYQYKVSAYIYTAQFSGEYSPVVDTSTRAAKAVLKLKAGEGKVRLTWAPVTGAEAYDIYRVDELGGRTLLGTNTGNTACTYIAEGLNLDETYRFSVAARRTYNGAEYNGEPSEAAEVTVAEAAATSTQAKYFADDAAFKKSKAYTDLEFFKKNVDLKRSYVIPGLISTNVGGFVSTSMCPQGITFAKSYLLVTAYDLAAEENSVIYVMDKTSKKLLTTLVLPTNAHVGGIAFDGKYVWLTTGSKASAVLYSDIKKAAKAGEAHANIEFVSVCKLGISASYIAYYDEKLWIGSYDELKSTKLYSYDINDYGSTVDLDQADTVTMPTRVQGIAFTADGDLIVSRSCQLYQGLRGYLRQIDVYRPDFSDEADEISLGDSLYTAQMPSMNEGIAVNGTRLYVLFESGAFPNASYPVDRIAVFKLSSIMSKTTAN